MCDEADIASEKEELERQAALIVRKRVGPRFTGYCANCGLPVDMPLRWCNAECREDWDHREKR